MFEYLSDEIRLIRRGSSLRDRLNLARMGVRLHLHIGRASRCGRWVPLGPVREIDLTLDDGALSLRLRSSDVTVIEIMGMDAYDVDLSPLGTVKTVLDVGANVGMTSIYLSQRMGDADFFCVEASSHSFALLEENLRRNVPRASAINAALVPRPGHFRVVEGSYSGITRVDPDEGQSGTRVTALTLPQVLDRAGFDIVDLMKLDIEGGELGVFECAGDWATRVRAILAEVHPPLTVLDAQRQLSTYGYEPLPISDNPKFDQILFVGRGSHNNLDTYRHYAS